MDKVQEMAEGIGVNKGPIQKTKDETVGKGKRPSVSGVRVQWSVGSSSQTLAQFYLFIDFKEKIWHLVKSEILKVVNLDRFLK